MQKFQKGDWVRIAKDLGPSMSHFKADWEAIVIGSYADQYGGNNHEGYTLYIKGRGESSWYYERQLMLIEPARLDKLKQWRDETEAECKEKSDLDWIFAHGEEVLASPHGASIQALASCFGLMNLWGSHGEAFTYYCNAHGTMQLAAPYLRAGDKAVWLMFCEELTAACNLEAWRNESLKNKNNGE